MAIHFNKHNNANFNISVLDKDEDIFKSLVKEAIWIELTNSNNEMNTHSWGHYDLIPLVINTYRHFQHDTKATPVIHTMLQ